MKVYTRKGDDGNTSLLGGNRVSKADCRINAYGSVDELNSYLGLLRDQEINSNRQVPLITIQNILFTIGSHLALKDESAMAKLPEIKEEQVTYLENLIDEIEVGLPPMNNFVLPGGHQAVSIGHIARTVCRRAEREIVDLSQQAAINPVIVQYMNRLSDYLFVLCRMMTQELGIDEIPWKPEKDG